MHSFIFCVKLLGWKIRTVLQTSVRISIIPLEHPSDKADGPFREHRVVVDNIAVSVTG